MVWGKIQIQALNKKDKHAYKQESKTNLTINQTKKLADKKDKKELFNQKTNWQMNES